LPVETRYTSPPIAGVVEVQRVDAFGLLRDRALLYSSTASPQELQRHHYHFWVDAPTELIRDQLVQYLRDAHMARLVTTDHLDQDADLRLQLELRDFSRLLHTGGRAGVRVELGVMVNPKGRGAPWLVKRYAREVTAADASPAAAVTAFDQALAQIYPELLADLLQALPQE
jgi:ABC-type uncharacterized transport system auxiliary subunit